MTDARSTGLAPRVLREMHAGSVAGLDRLIGRGPAHAGLLCRLPPPGASPGIAEGPVASGA